MTHIICRASNCLFWDQSVCSSEEIEYEPDAGCLTFQDMGDLELAEEDGEKYGWDESGDDLFDDDEDWEEEDDDWADDWEEEDL